MCSSIFSVSLVEDAGVVGGDHVLDVDFDVGIGPL